jgi:hypothetical protein
LKDYKQAQKLCTKVAYIPWIDSYGIPVQHAYNKGVSCQVLELDSRGWHGAGEVEADVAGSGCFGGHSHWGRKEERNAASGLVLLPSVGRGGFSVTGGGRGWGGEAAEEDGHMVEPECWRRCGKRWGGGRGGGGRGRWNWAHEYEPRNRRPAGVFERN